MIALKHVKEYKVMTDLIIRSFMILLMIIATYWTSTKRNTVRDIQKYLWMVRNICSWTFLHLVTSTWSCPPAKSILNNDRYKNLSFNQQTITFIDYCLIYELMFIGNVWCLTLIFLIDSSKFEVIIRHFRLFSYNLSWFRAPTNDCSCALLIFFFLLLARTF